MSHIIIRITIKQLQCQSFVYPKPASDKVSLAIERDVLCNGLHSLGNALQISAAAGGAEPEGYAERDHSETGRPQRQGFWAIIVQEQVMAERLKRE